MATICTSDLIYAEDFEIDIVDPDFSHGGWTVVFMGGGDEVRVTLLDEHMQALADLLAEYGYTPKQGESP